MKKVKAKTKKITLQVDESLVVAAQERANAQGVSFNKFAAEALKESLYSREEKFETSLRDFRELIEDFRRQTIEQQVVTLEETSNLIKAIRKETEASIESQEEMTKKVVAMLITQLSAPGASTESAAKPKRPTTTGPDFSGMNNF